MGFGPRRPSGSTSPATSWRGRRSVRPRPSISKAGRAQAGPGRGGAGHREPGVFPATTRRMSAARSTRTPTGTWPASSPSPATMCATWCASPTCGFRRRRSPPTCWTGSWAHQRRPGHPLPRLLGASELGARDAQARPHRGAHILPPATLGRGLIHRPDPRWLWIRRGRPRWTACPDRCRAGAGRGRTWFPPLLAEDEVGIGGAVEPAVGLDLGFQLPRRPARIAERQHRAARSVPRRWPSECRAWR